MGNRKTAVSQWSSRRADPSTERWLNKLTNGDQLAKAEIRTLQTDLELAHVRMRAAEEAAFNFRNYVRALTCGAPIDESIVRALAEWRFPRVDQLPPVRVYEAGDSLITVADGQQTRREITAPEFTVLATRWPWMAG